MMELLERHFEIAVETPDGIKKLKDLILTLAMQGKLVPQDPRDQSANELIKAAKTKSKLLSAEENKKKNELFITFKLEQLSLIIPNGWEFVSLGEITSLITKGATPTSYGFNFQKSGIPFVKVENVKNGAIQFTKKMQFISKEAHEFQKRSQLEANDILFSIAGTIGETCIVKTEDLPANTNQALAIIRGYSHIFLPSFLIKALNSSVAEKIKSRARGAAMNNISLGDIKEMIVPVPPLEEQKRIIAKIDQLMALCDRLESEKNERNNKRLKVHTSAINKLLTAPDKSKFCKSWNFIAKNFSELYSVPENVEELKTTILQLAVMGKLVPQNPKDQPASKLLKDIHSERQKLINNGLLKKSELTIPIKDNEISYQLPQGWKWTRLSELVEVGTGSTPQKTNKDYYNGNIPWYTSSATNDPIAKTPTTYITERALKETNCKVFPAGSLIIALYGQGKTRGQISEIVVPGATNQAIAAMVFNEVSKHIKPYLKFYFIKIYNEIRTLAEGAAQPNLNVGKIKNTLVPLPPLHEQNRIVEKINRLFTLCNILEQQLNISSSKQTEIFRAVLSRI